MKKHERSRLNFIEANPNDHLEILWKWRNSNDWIQYCTKNKFNVSLEEFGVETVHAFANDRFLQFIIQVVDSNTISNKMLLSGGRKFRDGILIKI